MSAVTILFGSAGEVKRSQQQCLILAAFRRRGLSLSVIYLNRCRINPGRCIEMAEPSPRHYPPGTRPLRQIFGFTLLIGGIMFIGAAALYGMTLGLLALEPIVKSWAASWLVH